MTRLFRQASRIPVGRRHFRVDVGVMRQILSLSGSATLQNLIGMASWIGLVRILAGYGSEALAGYTIAVRLIIFALLPSWGLSNAAATMVGQSLGARKPDRAERAVWQAGAYNGRFLVCGGHRLLRVRAPSSCGPSPTTRWSPTTPSIACGSWRWAIPLYAYGMVLTQSFNGAGRHLDAHLAQPGVFLDLRDSPRLDAGGTGGAGADRRVLGDHGVVLSPRPRQRGALPTRPLEDPRGLTVSAPPENPADENGVTLR